MVKAAQCWTDAKGFVPKDGCLTLLSDGELHLPHVSTHTCPHLRQAIAARYAVPFTPGTWHGACLHVYISINIKPGFLGNQ